MNGNLQRPGLKVLISAFACEPKLGSEPGVGWNLASLLAERHRVHVLTAELHRPGVERYIAAHPCPNLTFSFYDPLRLGSHIRPATLPWNIYYLLWQHGIARWARGIIAEFSPDIIHHVSYVRYWMGNSLADLPVPFVFGPVGGGDSTPKGFRRTYPWLGRLEDFARNRVRDVFEWNRLMRRTIRRSRIIFVSTPDCMERVRRLQVRNVHLLSDSGLTVSEIDEIGRNRTMSPAGPPRFVAAARLQHWKGVHLSIAALAATDLPDAVLEIYGDGPVRPWLERKSTALGVRDRVHFRGRVNRQEMLRNLGSATALLHPSMHDSGGWICLEAMSAGVPVIAIRNGGPAVIVDHVSGFLVESRDPAQAIRDIAAAMRRLAREPGLRERMGDAGQKRVRDRFTWRAKIETFERAYRECIEG